DAHTPSLPNAQAEMSPTTVRNREEVPPPDPESWEPYEMRVNRPLRMSGTRVYLQGHGYAPTFTVAFPNGETRTDTQHWEPTVLMTFLSSGMLRFDPPAGMYPELAERRQNQVAIQGLFA